MIENRKNRLEKKKEKKKGKVNWKEKKEKRMGKKREINVHMYPEENKKVQGTNPFSNESYIKNNTL